VLRTVIPDISRFHSSSLHSNNRRIHNNVLSMPVYPDIFNLSKECIIVVQTLSDALRSESLEDALSLVQGNVIDPVADDIDHILVQLQSRIQERGMHEAR
jgi:hypothetical protein